MITEDFIFYKIPEKKFKYIKTEGSPFLRLNDCDYEEVLTDSGDYIVLKSYIDMPYWKVAKLSDYLNKRCKLKNFAHSLEIDGEIVSTQKVNSTIRVVFKVR